VTQQKRETVTVLILKCDTMFTIRAAITLNHVTLNDPDTKEQHNALI